MLKDFLLVGAGSFLGGGLRFLVAKMLQTAGDFPLGTFAVNVVGCFLIGFLYGLKWDGEWLSPSARLMLTTGFCGGFTTFSTFMNECDGLRDNVSMLSFYLFASLALGFVALLLGRCASRLVE